MVMSDRTRSERQEGFEPVERIELLGGDCSLDFANTSSRRTAPDGPNERLGGYADLVTWSERAGIVDGEGAAALRREAQRRPTDAALQLERARRLREAIYGVFSAVGRGDSPSAADIDVLDREYHVALARRRLEADATGGTWRWLDAADPLERPLGPVAFSAVELLTSDRLERVRECTNTACNWLFIDASRNRSRRWCDMSDCGNRAKARRHYARTRSSRSD